MGIPLSRVLLDFGAARTPSPAAPASASITLVPPCDPADDLARRIDEAYARGADEARLTADAEYERRLAQALARAEEERIAERARWASEQAGELATGLTSAVEALETRIAEAVGQILTHFVTAELRSKSLEALEESIKTLLSGAGRPALRVGGPEVLLFALRERLGAAAAAIDWASNGEVDVTVSSDDSVIETEIQSWADRLAGARR